MLLFFDSSPRDVVVIHGILDISMKSQLNLYFKNNQAMHTWCTMVEDTPNGEERNKNRIFFLDYFF